MSKLEELILKYCPDGVEKVKLGDVCKVVKGNSLSKSDIGLGDVPIILYGELYTTYGHIIRKVVSKTSLDIARKATLIQKGDILLPLSSTTKEAQIGKASVYDVEYDAYLGGDAMILRNSQNSYYLAYYINSALFEKEKMRCVQGTTIMHLHPLELMKISIPLPPLPVQEEIVRTLDSMVDLQNNIEAELKERKKQYEHYRKQILGELLPKLCPDGVGKVRLGKIVNVVTVPKKLSKKDYLISGIYPIVDQGQKNIVAYTNDESALVPKDDYVIFGDHTREIKFVNFKFAQGADGVKILKSKVGILPRYLYYSMTNLDIISRGYNRHWIIVQDMEIPLPPLPVQEEIVRILDSMTALQDNLEAELAERRKQYEYYRNKILSFE